MAMENASKWIVEVEPANTEASPVAGPVYRSVFAKDGFPSLKGVETCWDIFRSSCEKFPDNELLGHRPNLDGQAQPYVWKTYKEAKAIVDAVGSAFIHIGKKSGQTIGIYGANSPEWVMAMEAVSRQNLIGVPLYDSLGPDAVQFIINHAGVTTAVVQKIKMPVFLDVIPKCGGSLKSVICMGELDSSWKSKAAEQGVDAYSWQEFIDMGKANPVEPNPPKASDISTIMYTSGTTGEPKGVVLSHEALLAVIASCDMYLMKVNFEITAKDVFISYLPLAHILDRTLEEFMIYKGAKIGFWQGDVKLLVHDIGELKPTVFPGVPRIFDRIYQGVTAKVKESGRLKQAMFNWAYNWKLSRLELGIPSSKATPVWNMLVFGKIKQRLGGRVRIIISGAAPIARHVEDFMHVAMCAPVVQGYGLTETCAGNFICIPDQKMAGTVGPPLPNVDVRLEAVPEMNYDPLGNPPRGEICMRGKPLFKGYYKRDDLTKEAIVDGWFHTGDIGEWQPDGSMKIIDRKKNIFKLSQGEYVAVENLENIYGQCSAVEMVWVYGNSFESVLVAVAVPKESALLAWAASAGIEGDYEALCAKAEASKWILQQLTEVGKRGKLKGYELVKTVHLDHRPFDMERDLLTPTFKKKRPQLLKYYKAEVDAMYAEVKKKEVIKPSA
ncbi:hypothetical protein CBR_g34297 [Chara braunii]|uniref:Long-chain-fatty-acid--CoA ligase n=1 Tax=Chara braunii TaxID=69332 RepID=A0A388JYR6_CHABU|nr:hypothetical protein CBR_g34297 [Chara braunii]|eukprot:GBG62926.1 hypothetical protein CBR_g34297 [Chara braunii]